MGSESSVSEQAEQHQSINHPKLKTIKYVHNNEIMKAFINVQHSDDFQEWEQRLAQLNNFDQYYLLLPKSYSFGRKAVCGSSGVLQADYDNFPYLLSDQISNRIPHSNHFTETQLWYLLYGLVSSANIFRKLDSKIGDVDSKNIFLNEEGQIKISNICSWPSQHTNYEKLIFQHIPTYVSPEQLQLSKQGRVDIYKNNNPGGVCDKYLCESFSIGITLLQSALLNSSTALYDNKRKIIQRQQLNRRINKLLQMPVLNAHNTANDNNNNFNGYSTAIKIAIAGMCEINPQDRLPALELYNWLKQYQSELSNLRPCNVEVPGVRNRQKYEQIVNNVIQNNSKMNSNINNNNYGNVNNMVAANSKQLFGNKNENRYNKRAENVYETNYDSRYDGYKIDKKYTNINNSPMDTPVSSGGSYLLMTPPSSTNSYITNTGVGTKSYPTTDVINGTYGSSLNNYDMKVNNNDTKWNINSNDNKLNMGGYTSTNVGYNPNVNIGSSYNNASIGNKFSYDNDRFTANISAYNAVTPYTSYTSSYTPLLDYKTNTNTNNNISNTNNNSISNNNNNNILSNINSFGNINTSISNINGSKGNGGISSSVLDDNKYKYDTFNVSNTFKPNDYSHTYNYNHNTSTNYNNNNNNISNKTTIPATTSTTTTTTTTAAINSSNLTTGIGNPTNTSLYPGSGYPYSTTAYDKTSANSLGTGMNINTKFGSGNAYLHDIYSLEAKTPTFSNPITTFSNSNSNKDITFDSKNINNLYVGSIDPYLKQGNKDINTTFGNLNKGNTLGNTSNNYSFSNISSIPREDPLSANKIADNVNVFTPTHTYNANMGDTKYKNDDSSTDLLKRINQEITKTKQKYTIDDHSP